MPGINGTTLTFTFFLFFSMTIMYFTCKLSILQFDIHFPEGVFNHHYIIFEPPRLYFRSIPTPKMPVPWEALIPFGLLDYLILLYYLKHSQGLLTTMFGAAGTLMNVAKRAQNDGKVVTPPAVSQDY